MQLPLSSLIIGLYRYLISPLIHTLAGPGFGCRFSPTCSQYVSEAFRTHGLWAGFRLSISRLCRCHPFSEAGVDPVPRAIAEPQLNRN